MIGHDLTLHETNIHGWVPICECGWIGGVVQLPAAATRRYAMSPARVELAKSIAADSHAIHLREVEADIARDSELALAAHGRLIDRANETLQRRGRFGHP